MSESTYRHSRILVRTDRPACRRSRPERPGSLPARAKRWWRTHVPERTAATDLWQHAFFFAPDAAGVHPAARQCLNWKETY
ncbi:hypothetical protein ACFYV7_16855 [Nocardia suismassiliense]|uniref:Uncharacterized protein n=1 Tax=Nocardia suismassiliense TaxID=2077092 RepID=A0ABW6QTA0_9NOCA